MVFIQLKLNKYDKTALFVLATLFADMAEYRDEFLLKYKEHVMNEKTGEYEPVGEYIEGCVPAHIKSSATKLEKQAAVLAQEIVEIAKLQKISILTDEVAIPTRKKYGDIYDTILGVDNKRIYTNKEFGWIEDRMYNYWCRFYAAYILLYEYVSNKKKIDTKPIANVLFELKIQLKFLADCFGDFFAVKTSDSSDATMVKLSHFVRNLPGIHNLANTKPVE